MEFGARRQQLALSNRLISTSELLNLIGAHFGINFDTYVLQIYDNILNEYHSVEDDKQIFDVIGDTGQLQRFRIVNKPFLSQVGLNVLWLI